MPGLPAGTVTFLFTDIEGSTRLLRQLGARYSGVLAEHRRILRDAAAARQGHEVDTQGDSFFFAFARANSALGAAVVAQRALAAHDWPDGAAVRVRMGLHTGEPEVGDERYVGLGVHRAARIGSVAHGGQVVLSSATRELVEENVDGVVVRELGSFRLKDFDQPERLYQLDIEGLPSSFPPLRAEPVAAKRRLLLAAGALLVACLAAALAVVLLTRGGDGVELGPTSMAVVDPATRKVVDAVDLGFKSNLIAAGEGAIWVVDPEGSTLWRIDPRTHEKRNIGISVGAGAVPFGVAAGYGAVWVAVLRGTRSVVLKLGPTIGDLRGTIPYGGSGTAPVLVYLQPLAVGEGAVWAIDPEAGGIWRIPPRGGPARRLAEGLSPLSLAAGGDALWVANAIGVSKVDPATGNELGSALNASGEVGEIGSVAVGFDATWFASSSAAKLSKIDLQSASTTETFEVGQGPSGIAAGEQAVWVANSRDGTISRVDPLSGEEQIVRLGQAPGGIVSAYGAVWTSPGNPRS